MNWNMLLILTELRSGWRSAIIQYIYVKYICSINNVKHISQLEKNVLVLANVLDSPATYTLTQSQAWLCVWKNIIIISSVGGHCVSTYCPLFISTSTPALWCLKAQ